MGERVLRWLDSPLLGERRAQAIALLTPAERARLDTDRAPERFLGGRMMLREAVAELTGRALASITVTAACPDCGLEHGQPRVDGSVDSVFVSLSHAGGVSVAVAGTAPVGVDVEPRDAPRERIAAIHDVAGGGDLTHWTRVEAVLKAEGRGLRVDPRAVSIHGDKATLDGVRYVLSDVGTDRHAVSVATRL